MIPDRRQGARILLVEDNLGDVRLTIEALRERTDAANFDIASDGSEALHFLRRQGPHAEAARPDLVFLDLNLPKRSGREVLADIKTDPTLRQIPVIIFTTSAAPEDVATSYDLHTNCFVTKPLEFEQFVDALTSVYDFWVTVAELPPHCQL